MKNNRVMCKLKIMKFLLGFECSIKSNRSWYIVQQFLLRVFTRNALTNIIISGGRNQKRINYLFNLGKTISSILKKIRISQLPKVLIIKSIIIKNHY